MLLPSPEEVRATFTKLMQESPERAVAYLYDLGITSGYINTEAIAKNIKWTAPSPYGDLECTINVSKPEKDPAEIAAAVSALDSPATGDALANVPQCDLCWENEEFPGTAEHPAKPGLRIAPISLGAECWGLQYSPYAYFDEHCIALSREHRPMRIDEFCLERLLSFVDQFPFYFIGANADLPIVGGSILSHDHFQGGHHEFPLMKAPLECEIALNDVPSVQCGIVAWPASVLRLVSENRADLLEAATRILTTWRSFSHEECGIIAATEGSQHNALPSDSCQAHTLYRNNTQNTPPLPGDTQQETPKPSSIQHNTLNPIVRKQGSTYIMDMVLRNNRTDAEHPWGIFHAPEWTHYIKKENIGLIEIMGLAILPPRLLSELQPLDQQEVANVFLAILEATGVFKHDETGRAGWNAFLCLL